MEYLGYSIAAVKEQTMGPQGDPNEKPVTITTYQVSVGKKIVAVGLPDQDTAKQFVDVRRTRRQRINLNPDG